jgi:hypothetical protein
MTARHSHKLDSRVQSHPQGIWIAFSQRVGWKRPKNAKFGKCFMALIEREMLLPTTFSKALPNFYY